MKNRIILAFIVTILLGGEGANAGLGDWFYGESWKFMEDVGGIAVGSPSRNPQDKVYLPVRCDVSGLTTITNKPTMMNSALSVKSIGKKIDELKIYISINTGLVSKNETCLCSGVDLGDIPAGDYQVYYYGSDREKHQLGKVTVPAKIDSVGVTSKSFEIKASITPKFRKFDNVRSKIEGNITISNRTSTVQKYGNEFLQMKVNGRLLSRTYKESITSEVIDFSVVEIKPRSSLSQPVYWVFEVPRDTKVDSVQMSLDEEGIEKAQGITRP